MIKNLIDAVGESQVRYNRLTSALGLCDFSGTWSFINTIKNHSMAACIRYPSTFTPEVTYGTHWSPQTLI